MDMSTTPPKSTRSFSEGVAPQNNPAALLVQIYPGEITSEDYMRRYCEAMGIKTVPRSGDHFVGLHTYLNRIGGIEMLGSSEEKQKLSDRNWQSYNPVMKNVWSESEYPDVAAWLTKNEKHIEVVRAASRRPR